MMAPAEAVEFDLVKPLSVVKQGANHDWTSTIDLMVEWTFRVRGANLNVILPRTRDSVPDSTPD